MSIIRMTDLRLEEHGTAYMIADTSGILIVCEFKCFLISLNDCSYVYVLCMQVFMIRVGFETWILGLDLDWLVGFLHCDRLKARPSVSFYRKQWLKAKLTPGLGLGNCSCLIGA